MQIRPSVIPLLQHLLTEGSFQVTTVKSKPAAAALAVTPAADDAASESEDEGMDVEGRAGQEEQSGARLIFTSEQPLPWLEKLATTVKVSCACSRAVDSDDYINAREPYNQLDTRIHPNSWVNPPLSAKLHE